MPKNNPPLKPSGIDWLGDIPAHWHIRRAKWLFTSKKELNTSEQESQVLSLTLRGVVDNDPDNPEGLVPHSYTTYQLFSKGDLVFKLIDLENLRTSRVGYVHKNGIMSPAYIRLIPNSAINARYFYHQFYDLYLRGVYNQLGAGVRSTLGVKDLLAMKILLPPIAEQNRIVRHIDDVCGTINARITANEKMTALLREQRQATINEATTGKTDLRTGAPYPAYQPTQIPWLAQIPIHWQMIKLKTQFTNFGSGTTPPHDSHYENGTIPWVMVGDLNDDTIHATKRHVTPHAVESIGGLKIHDSGTLLISMYAGAAIGKTGILAMPACCNQACLALSNIKNTAHAQYVQHVIATAKDFLTKQSFGGAQPNINSKIVKSLKIPLPPLAEQKAIVAHITRATAAIDAKITKTQKETALLQEYRTRLTTDLVTGKLTPP